MPEVQLQRGEREQEVGWHCGGKTLNWVIVRMNVPAH